MAQRQTYWNGFKNEFIFKIAVSFFIIFFWKRRFYPLVVECDMPEEMRVETQELCVTAAEKFATNNESAAKFVREQMDKKFGTGWHVVIGESFDPFITFDQKSKLYMFVGGTDLSVF